MIPIKETTKNKEIVFNKNIFKNISVGI